MRIALVVPTFPQLSETFLVTKVVGLVARGLDIQIVCADSGEQQWAAFGPGHGVHALRDRVRTTLSTHPRSAVPATVARTVLDLWRTNRQGLRRTLSSGPPPAGVRNLYLDAPLLALRPDLVHFEFGALAVGRERLGHRLDSAVTVSFRGSDINYIGLDVPGFYDAVWTEVDGVHVLGEALWRRAQERGAPKDLAHTIIAPAIDVDAVQVPDRDDETVGTPERPLRVLSVGRLHWTKAYDDALEAIADLGRRGVHVEHRIVGGGDLLGPVSFWRHQLGLDDTVELLGPLPPAEVAEQYRWADLFLHTAIVEGFCNAVVEAQANALPVVCTDAGGLSENVDHQVTGLVVPRRDPAGAAEALAALAADSRRRLDLGRAGRARAERRFRLDDQLDAWERFYDAANSTRADRRRASI